MTATDAFPGELGSRLTLRVLVTLAALTELVYSAASVPVLFIDHSQIPGPGVGGAIILATIALNPLLAITAIVYALTGWPRAGVSALAGVGICTWFNSLPKALSRGLDISFSFAGLPALQTVAYSAFMLSIAFAAIWLALRTRRLGLATALACLPAAIKLCVVIAIVVYVNVHEF